MNIRNLFFAAILIFSFSACRETANEDHGHEHEEGAEMHAHDEDGGHMDEDHMEQEEFMIDDDSPNMHEDGGEHTHEDGTEHDH